jgi:hypothetical protein
MEKGRAQCDRFCDDLRSASPPQRLAFLVGRPEYLVDSPNTDNELPMESEDVAIGSAKGISPVDPGVATQRLGHSGSFTTNLRRPLRVHCWYASNARAASSASRF